MPPVPSARELLHARSVKALLTLVALSTAGSVIQAVALGKFVFDTTEDAPKILYRQDLSALGWALGRQVREDLQLAKALRR